MNRTARMIGVGCVAAVATVLSLGATAQADDGAGTDGTRVTGDGTDGTRVTGDGTDGTRVTGTDDEPWG